MEGNLMKSEREKLHLHNYMEDLVIEKMDELLADYPGACKCDICRTDIATYALNHLPPKYFATHQGEIYTRLEEWKTQVSADLITVILKGIKLITQNPRHG